MALEIDARGRVVPGSDEARRALAGRAGRFTLLPSTGDLLLLRRTPAAGDAGAKPRCVLAGDLAGVGAADLVTFVHQARLSGVLTVIAEGVERSVAFVDGEVRAARSTVAGERLGEIAVRLGLVGEAAIEAAVRAGPPIGKALVDGGHLAPAELWRCLHEQVTAIFHAMLLARAGTFFLLEEAEEPDRPAAPIAVNTQSLLMEGIRRVDELALFRTRIPGTDVAVRRRRPKGAPSLKAPERAVLALVDGRRTVGEIAAAAHLGDFDATKLLHHLSELGLVEVVDGPKASPIPRGPARARAARPR